MRNTLTKGDVLKLIGSFNREASPASVVSSWRPPQITPCISFLEFLPAKGDFTPRAEPHSEVSVHLPTSNIHKERIYVLHRQANHLRRLRYRIHVLLWRAGAFCAAR